jgi:hypothetical protein
LALKLPESDSERVQIMIKKMSIYFTLFFIPIVGVGQVFNYGYDEITYKNMLENGITYVKTGDTLFDSTMLACLDKYWTITEFKVVEQYKRPEKNNTALIVYTKEKTNKHMMDRQNQHVLVLKSAEDYAPRREVNMVETIGYMYFNGFYGLVAEQDEYKFIYLMIQSLHRGVSLIREKKLSGEDIELNAKITAAINNETVPSVGNTLIVNREQTRHAVNREMLEKLNIDYRLLSEEEYYATLAKKNPKHVILYFAENTFTEVALLQIVTGELFYTEHFRDDYSTIDKKTMKDKISPYFH